MSTEDLHRTTEVTADGATDGPTLASTAGSPLAIPDGMADDFAEMALSLHDEDSLLDTVERVLEYAVKAVGCSHAGVILVHGGRKVETVASTHEVVAELDAVQFDLGEGPDLEVMDDHDSVVVPDTHLEDRWPRWAGRVADRGIRSMMGVRLHTSDSTIGSLNFYALDPHAFDDEDVRIARVLARHAGVALACARDSESLWQAIESRHVIGQAQGILMERYGLGADAAFAVLKRCSQDYNIKLRAVAEQLIETRVLPELDPEELAPGAGRGTHGA